MLAESGFQASDGNKGGLMRARRCTHRVIVQVTDHWR